MFILFLSHLISDNNNNITIRWWLHGLGC
jgi:hypothetical protein